MARTASSGDSAFSWFFEPSGVNSGAGRLTLSAQVPQICWGGSIIVCANRVATTTKAIAHTRYHGCDRAHSQAAAWLAGKGIDQWQEPWPTEDLMVEGMLANIEAGETFIVWDDDDTPAATITINRFAKPELWTPDEAAEPALYAHKVTVDRA
jgi:hypothetical protein